MRIRKSQLLDALPPEWPEDLLPGIQAAVASSAVKVVVLDDDPTGTQTVHDVPVLTEWSPAALAAVLSESDALVYVLTNSRSVPLAQAQAMNREIASSLREASEVTGREFVVVSRSDSTLRGHYPGEVEALVEGLNQTFDGTLIIPFFLEGGRLTIHDTHYVAEEDWLVPAAETGYAQDPTFGYRHSDLCGWVSEKHRGRFEPQDVAAISLTELRLGGPDAVVAALSRVNRGRICVVNAASYRDMEVFVAGLLRAEAEGQRFIYRTAASFVRVRGGIAPRSLLTSADLATAGSRTGGLIVVGSYVKKTTLQMEAVKSLLPDVRCVEVSVERLLDTGSRDDEIKSVADQASKALLAGYDAMVYTSRQVIAGSGGVSSLAVGRLVSAALVAIVESLSERPAWLVSKGGITSSDIAVQGLSVRRAHVLGQALPGIPIWRLGQESRWPGLIDVVFPGNVGGVNALAEMIQILRGEGVHRSIMRQSAGA